MKTLRCLVLSLILLGSPFVVSAQDAGLDTASARELAEDSIRIVVLDIASGTLDEGRARLLSDMLRSEMFKTSLFTIVDRGVIQQTIAETGHSSSAQLDDAEVLSLGEALDTPLILVCRLERFGDESYALNLRVIDTHQLIIEYTENTFIRDESFFVDAVRELVQKLSLFYSTRQLNPANQASQNERLWTLLGADDEDFLQIRTLGLVPQDFLDLRQYDVSFQIKDYIGAVSGGWSTDTIRSFLAEGIPYRHISRALSLGIASLDIWRRDYRPLGYSFADYLDAYAEGITDFPSFQDYQRGLEKNHLNVGLGGAADRFPLLNADLKFFLLHVSWEHFITNWQRNLFKHSVETGLELMNGFAPVPSIQYNFYLGSPPFYAKAAVGALAEIILGGHVGVYFKLGLEVLEQFEIEIGITPIYTQPSVSYGDLVTKAEPPDYVGGIQRPFFHAFFRYKFFF